MNIDWEVFSRFSHEPRGLAVPVSRADVSYASVLAAATRVRNALPIGATWSGEAEQLADRASSP